jgi:hypothetical protein
MNGLQNGPEQLPLPVVTIRTAFHELGHRVNQAIRTQFGDVARILEQRQAASHLLSAISLVSSSSQTFDHSTMLTHW